jgi:hypothetical protein
MLAFTSSSAELFATSAYNSTPTRRLTPFAPPFAPLSSSSTTWLLLDFTITLALLCLEGITGDVTQDIIASYNDTYIPSVASLISN